MTPLSRNASALALLAATFLARWPLRAVPLIRDEGELVHLAQALRSGVVPYLEVYNQKPPVAFALIGLVQSVFGESIEVLRIATTVWFLIGGAGLFLVARRLMGDHASLLALAAYCLMGYGQAGLVHQASTEVFSLPWLVLGLAAWLRARKDGSAGWALVAGVAAALAYQTKQTGIALSAAIALDVLLFGRTRATAHAALSALAGFVLLTAGVVAALAASGALGAYVDATWLHNWAYVGGRHGAGSASGLLSLPPVADADLVLWIAGAVGLGLLAVRNPVVGVRFVALLGATALAAALLAGKSYAHYYVPLIVPLALGVGVLGAELARRLPVWASVGLVVALFALPASRAGTQLVHWPRWIDTILESAPTVARAADVARYLEARTEPDEPVLVIGSEPQVYFLAARPAASRVAILYPVSGGYPHSAELLDELTEVLRDAPPRYVVLARDWRSFAEARPNARRLERHLQPLLEGRYELEHDFPGAYRVLRRRDPADSADTAGSADSASSAPRLLLLITTDTLRADHIGAYGSTLSRTPAIDALARESLRFEASYAPAPYTMPSVAALHTGRYPEELGILANHALFRGSNETLAELLRRESWSVGAVVSNYVLRRGTGLEAGFELYDDTFTQSEANRDQPERTAADTTDAALAVLDRLLADPGAGVFLWVHYQDPHGPYQPPGDLRERHLERLGKTEEGGLELPTRGINPVGAIPSYQMVDDRRDVAFYLAGYAGEVEYVDAQIARLLGGVEQRVPRTATTTVFTADHGESLGEDDYWFAHGAFLSDALVRVPLLIRDPAVAPGVRDDIVSLIDLMPTLLARFDVGAPDALLGRDLLAPGADAVAGRAYLANLMGSADKRWGWVEDGHVYVHEQLRRGPERSTLRTLQDGSPIDEPDRLARMQAELSRFRSSLRVQEEVQQHLSARDLEMLRRLGYVGDAD